MGFKLRSEMSPSQVEFPTNLQIAQVPQLRDYLSSEGLNDYMRGDVQSGLCVRDERKPPQILMI